jgi:hypothetical protein
MILENNMFGEEKRDKSKILCHFCLWEIRQLSSLEPVRIGILQEFPEEKTVIMIPSHPYL